MEIKDIPAFSFRLAQALCTAFEPVAKRNNLSSQAVLVLLAVSSGTDISFLVKDEFLEQLAESAFVEREGGILRTTGKGAIFAKSLGGIVSKVVKELEAESL